MKLNKLFTKTALFLVLLLTFTTQAWAASTKFRLLNANNEQVAYCESRNESGRTGMIPSDMVSPFVAAYTYYPTLEDAQAGTNGAANASGFSDAVAYVKYTLTAAGKELFTGGTYKIYANFASAYLAYSGNTEGKVVGSWGAQSGGDGIGNNTWILTGDPYSLQMHVASNPTLLASYSSATSSNQMAVRSTGAYNKFMIVSKGGGSGLILRINEPEGEYSPTVFSIIDKSGNEIRFWRENDMWKKDYGSKTFYFEKQSPVATLTTTNANPAKGEPVTLNATATLSKTYKNPTDIGTAITYTAIEQKDNVTGDYTEVVNTANSNSATYAFTPNAYGTFYFRAKAANDVTTNLPGYSEEIAITVPAPNVPTGNYTLKLIDKSGNELVSTTVSGTNIADSGLDPLPTQWRSPMVVQYKYYQGTAEGKASAQAADDTNLVDFGTITPDQTIYVGYVVGDALDLNPSERSHLTSLNDDDNSLMKNRVVRDGTTDTHVRKASNFGKMYMLKFKTSAPYYAEDTNDGVSKTQTAADSYVYPYTNGDGPLYVYPDKTYQETRDDGASTRTRYPWFLFSPNNDPYHVYITSWQTSHNQKVNGTTNYYSYLRTYYNSTLNQVVTSNVTDDPTTLDGTTQILPTEYMLLTGNGTYGAYKLMTTGEVNGARQTVTSLEQYWRNNPTAQVASGGTKNVTEVATNNATLTDKGWHNYEAWVNAAKWDGSKYADDRTKNYLKAPHWFQTIQLGDGSLDIVETNIDGVLVLLDNHGWEIMRHPIVQHTDPDYASVKEALKKYDSPMVSTYKFYATRNVDHKVAGYHKYNINNGASKTLTDAKHLKNAGTVITSLADYPETMDNGALADLYVTYDVKEEYKANYVGAATESDVTKSAVNLLQGGKYAKANGTSITDETDAAQASKWYLKPNFNIDAEMGYKYDVDVNGLDEGPHLTIEQTNAAYHAHKQSGFDPYNIQIQNVADETKYFTTNASSATLDAGKWSGNGETVSLADVQSHIAPTGYDQTTLAVTNTTFMAVQDANGNMRLMPRFDHSQVVENFTKLAEQATLNAKNDNHTQSTKLSVGSITYKVIDNSGTEVFSETVTDGAGISLPRRLESPFVEKYTYHSSLELAKGATRGITSDVTGTNIPSGGTVYVGYKVKDNFGNGNYWNIFGAGTNGLYVHPVYQSETKGKANTAWWKMAKMQIDFAGWTSKDINTSNFPFLDNGYAWEFAGENPDPYNALLFNKGAKMYIKHYYASNARTTDFLTPNVNDAELDRYAFVYFDNNEESDDLAMYNRHKNGSNVDDGGFVTFENNNKYLTANRNMSNRANAQRFVVTQLPQITINVVNSDHVVEVSLQGYYKKGATWTNSTAHTVDNTPFYLDRAFAEGHTFYYDRLCTDKISGTVSDSKVLAKDSVFVSYTLASDWGTVNETNPDYGTTFRPADNDYLYWYIIRPGGTDVDGYHFKAQTTGTPSEIGATNQYTFTNENINDEASRLTQWTFRGTPYNLKIVDRYHGEYSWVGVSRTAVAGDKAYVYDTYNYNPEEVATTWELMRSLTPGENFLYIRPQRALEGSNPLLYLSNESKSNKMTNFLAGVQVKFVTKTPANTITFKIQKGHDNLDMTTYNIADFVATGVPAGERLSTVFSHSPQLRRYCEYKFYTDEECTQEITLSTAENLTVYVKWDYTADAPVFSQESWNKLDYQYYMLGVWGFSNYNLMDVEGEGTTESPYTFKPNSDVGTPRDLKHQFAVVGNPYGFKLYNRAADKDIRRNAAREITFADKEADGTKPTEEITFDLPIVSGRAYTSTETHFRSTKTGRYLSVTGTTENKLFSMTDNASNKTRFRYLIIPVRVFPEGKTGWTSESVNDQVDYRMYAKEMNPGGTAVSTDARITTDDLRATANSVGSAYDFVHAFCDYTFYRSYDWSSTLSEDIPAEGLSYYGGKDQTKRQFFATYVVDREQFENIYLLAKGDGSPFSGKGDAVSAASGYGLTSTVNKADARADINGTYRWVMTGDPYNLQLTCLGTGEFYKDMPLSAAGVADNNKLYLSGDATNYRLSHFEVIKRHDGKYRFYLREDLDNDEDVEDDRYQYHINPSVGYMNNLILFSNNTNSGIADLLLFPAIPQHNVTWHVMEKAATGDTYTEVATATVVKEEGEKLVLADLPQETKRHFCEYNAMFSTFSGNSTTAGELSNDITTTGYTVPTGGAESDAYHIYVPYTLDSGAPDFVTEAEVAGGISQNKWYEIHFVEAGTHIYYDVNNSNSQMNYDGNGIEAIRDYENDTEHTHPTDAYQYYRWALVGSPYNVKFYNKKMQTYLTSDGTVGDLTTLSEEGTAFDLPDDESGNLCDIRHKATGTVVDRHAKVSKFNHTYTSCEFTNTNGVVKITFVLHYSNQTLRKYYGDEGFYEGENEGDAAGKTEIIKIDTYQKLNKSILDVLPAQWKRAFCNYTFHWDNDPLTTVSETTEETVTTVNQAMVDAYNAKHDEYLYVHVTYDFTGEQCPFNWSSQDGESPEYHWYYLVNNHRPAGEQGKMVFRSTDPSLRVSESLVDSKLYLSNYEWCVIGDPYGFKLLNRYDPDKRFDEYISVTTSRDVNNEGNKLQQVSGNDNSLFEMMPGQYDYNFWMHPINNDDYDLGFDYTNNSYGYVGNNFNGSAAIIPDTKRSYSYLKTCAPANFRLEIQSDHTLYEYVKYAGFVGALKYDADGLDVIRANVLDNEADLTPEEKTAVRNLIDNPNNIVQMTQGYYRIIPYAQEGGSTHNYVRGYLDDRERTSSSGFNNNLKIETSALAEYDPASIFWFEGTTEDGHPRYFVRTQGLNLSANTLSTGDAFKVRYEDLGAAITQLKVAANSGDRPADYLSCSSATATETSINQNFDEQAGVYKTRFYLQKVGTGKGKGYEMPFKIKMAKGHNGNGNESSLLEVNKAYFKLPYTYKSLYVPYDMQAVGGIDKDDNDVLDVTNEQFDMIPFIGLREHYYSSEKKVSDTYYNKDEYALYCESIDDHQQVDEWKGYNFYIPAGTPVIFRSLSGMQEITFTIPTTEPSEKIQENCLQGTYLKKGDDNAQIRVFGKESVRSKDGTKYYTGRVGLFPRTSTASLLAANSIYYEELNHSTSQQVNAPGVMFIFGGGEDDATGLNGSPVRTMPEDDSLYDLQGRKVIGTARPGVYIRNGRKVVIK